MTTMQRIGEWVQQELDNNQKYCRCEINYGCYYGGVQGNIILMDGGDNLRVVTEHWIGNSIDDGDADAAVVKALTRWADGNFDK